MSLHCSYIMNLIIKRKAPAPIGVEAEAATPRESLRIEPALRSVSTWAIEGNHDEHAIG
jgi:hypothetical protein